MRCCQDLRHEWQKLTYSRHHFGNHFHLTFKIRGHVHHWYFDAKYVALERHAVSKASADTGQSRNMVRLANMRPGKGQINTRLTIFPCQLDILRDVWSVDDESPFI